MKLEQRRFFSLSPLNKRRLANFRAHRRGLWSLRIFLILLIVSLISEFIANDRPLFASYKGELLFPALITYPEEKFGGFLAVTDYRDPAIQEEITAHGWVIWPPIRYSYNSVRSEGGPFPAKPTWLKREKLDCSI